MKRICALVFCFVLASATVVYADTPAQTEAPKPAPKAEITTPPPAAPPQDSIATLKLTIKLVKQNAKVQKEVAAAQLKLQIANTKLQIFQRQVTAKLTASRALASQ